MGSGFLRNVVTLVTGTAAAQFITIFSAPVLTRIYLPEEYGILGIFMSVAALTGILATLQYNQAIILPKEDEKANNLVYLCMFLTIGMTILSTIVMFLLNMAIANFLKAPEAAQWLLLVPISVFFGGITAAFNVWNNRHKRYKRLSISRVILTVVTVTTSITIGLNFEGPMGLIIGYQAGQGACLTFLVTSTLLKDKTLFSPFSGTIIRTQLQRYRNFPTFTLPSEFINRLTTQMPVYILSIFSGTAAIGLFNMCNRILALPISFIATAVAEVFKQKASEDYANLGNCQDIYLKTLKNLVAISILPFLVLILLAPTLFAFAFGEPWREAGVFAQLLGVMFFFKFIVSPLSYVYYIAGKQKEDFLLHLWILVSTMGAFWIGYYIFESTYISLLLYGLNYAAIYILYLIRSYQFAKGNLNSSFE